MVKKVPIWAVNQKPYGYPCLLDTQPENYQRIEKKNSIVYGSKAINTNDSVTLQNPN